MGHLERMDGTSREDGWDIWRGWMGHLERMDWTSREDGWDI